jgi:SPP1 family predicted phage head-tail adaptor
MKPLAAGRLRHQLTIERPSLIQDASGATSTAWSHVAVTYAAIEPLSARDFVAAQTLKSRASVRIVIRYRSGLNASMRLVGTDGTIYTPLGFLHDRDTGRDYLTVPASVSS